MLALFGEYVCENKRIWSHWGAMCRKILYVDLPMHTAVLKTLFVAHPLSSMKFLTGNQSWPIRTERLQSARDLNRGVKFRGSGALSFSEHMYHSSGGPRRSDLRRRRFSVKLYAKTKELGPVWGEACAGHVPQIRQCTQINYYVNEFKYSLCGKTVY